jgi:hypothetical protein
MFCLNGSSSCLNEYKHDEIDSKNVLTLAIEGMLIKCFNFEKIRSRKSVTILSFIVLIIVRLSNLDKSFARHLIINQSAYFLHRLEKSFWKISSKFIRKMPIICGLSNK